MRPSWRPLKLNCAVESLEASEHLSDSQRVPILEAYWRRALNLALLILALGIAVVEAGPAPVPEWIWHDNEGRAPAEHEIRFFRKTFTVEGDVSKALLCVAADDHVVVFINGKQVLRTDSYEKADAVEVTKEIRVGENLIAVRAQNDSGMAGFIGKLDLTFAVKKTHTIVTDISWLASKKEEAGWEKPGFVATGWTRPASLGKLGAAPWGDVMTGTVLKPPDTAPQP